MIRGDLIYTPNGGAQYEEWHRIKGGNQNGNEISFDLPEGATHYFLNLIDENNFLVSYPQTPDHSELSKTKKNSLSMPYQLSETPELNGTVKKRVRGNQGKNQSHATATCTIGLVGSLQDRTVMKGLIPTHPKTEGMAHEHLLNPFTVGQFFNHLDGIANGTIKRGIS